MLKSLFVAGAAGAAIAAQARGAIVEVTFAGHIDFARGEAPGLGAGAPFSVRCVFDDYGAGAAPRRLARVVACEVTIDGETLTMEREGALIATTPGEGALVESFGAVVELRGGMMAFLTLEAPARESATGEEADEIDAAAVVPAWAHACFELAGADLYAYGAVLGHEREPLVAIPAPAGAGALGAFTLLAAARRRRSA